MTKKKLKAVKKSEKPESMTFFEMQEAAWLDNNCRGNIEDYDGSEEPYEEKT